MNEAQLKNILQRMMPVVDKTLPRQENKNPFLKREKLNGKPMIPNLAALSDEERQTFLQSAGAQYLNNLMFAIMQIHQALAAGDFELATHHADFIWVAYPDLARFLDDEPPSKIIAKRQRDFENYKWIKYTGVDDEIIFSPNRKYIISDEQYADLIATRERAIAREYLLFEFLQRVIIGCNELGWFLTTDTRVDFIPEEYTQEIPVEEKGLE